MKAALLNKQFKCEQLQKKRKLFFKQIAAGFALASAISVGVGLVSSVEPLMAKKPAELNELKRSQAASSSAPQTSFTFSSSILPSFLIFALVYYFIHRKLRHKRTETALEQRNFTSAVLDTVGALVVVLDSQGRIVRFNSSCKQITGYSFDEVRGKYVWDLFLMPKDVEVFQDAFEKLRSVQGTRSFDLGVSLSPKSRRSISDLTLPEIGETCQLSDQYENYWLTRDGAQRLIAWSNTTLHDKMGAVEYVIATGIDITERKQAEEELREMSVALENAVEGISRLDAQECYITVNRAYANMFGYKPEQMIGMEWQSTVHPEERENMTLAYQYMLSNGKVETEARGLRKDGSVFYQQLVMISAYDKQQKFIGHYCFMKDITERKQTETQLQQANEKLASWVNELEQRNHEIALLGEMSDVLQACLTVEEAYTASATLMQPLFPHTSGGIFLLGASKNLVEAVASWGSPPLLSQEMFTPHECWALRRGRVHWVEDTDNDLLCKHLHHALPAESLCVPMMAQGEALGVLYLSSLEKGRLTQSKQQLAVTVTEHMALALANLKLRETLQNQSIRDPLTGLFNRRYMEESLERELHRSERKQQSLGIIMLDVDHFKRFNDTFGHEVGDAVLRELGLFLKKHIRKSDIACRYGGEELTLILPEASLNVVRQRAEQIRQGVKRLSVQYRHLPLGAITLSLGIACFPEHGQTAEELLRAADAALYSAKAEGRDRVVTAL